MAYTYYSAMCRIGTAESNAVGTPIKYGLSTELGSVSVEELAATITVYASTNQVEFFGIHNGSGWERWPAARFTATPAEGRIFGGLSAYDERNNNAYVWSLVNADNPCTLDLANVVNDFSLYSSSSMRNTSPLLLFFFPLAPLYNLTLEFNDKIKEIWVETYDTRGTFVKYTAANPVVKVRGNSTYRAYAVANAPWSSLDTAANPFVGTVGSSNPPAYQPTLVGADVILTFDPQGGDVSRYFKRVRIGAAYGELPTPTYDQYAFLGWYDSPTGGNLITATSIVTIEEEHTLFARWSIPAEMVRVTFDAAGGSLSTGSMQIAPGAALGTLPSPTRSGYRFLGWFTRIFGGVEITASSIAEVDMTIYAHWERTTEEPPPPPPTIPEGQGSADWFYFN